MLSHRDAPGIQGPESGRNGPAPYRRTIMAKELTCGDVVAGCSFTTTAGTEDELMAKAAKHAHEAHGVGEITPELAAKVKAAIKER